MVKSKQTIKNAIIESFLPDVAYDGWSWSSVLKAAAREGYGRGQVREAFPGGIGDVVCSYAAHIDDLMMARLDRIDPDVLRVRDRIRMAVLARFDALEPYKEAERYAVSYWSMPLRHVRAGKIVWRTADLIWNWAGDISDDYNHYTKRGLLSGILSTSTLVWLDDESDDRIVTSNFVDRRIDNVMQIGKIMGKIKAVA